MNKQGIGDIGWCTHTWNPITGCLHGCEYCYARKIATRFSNWGFETTCRPIADGNEMIGGLLHELNEPYKYMGDGKIEPYPFKFEPTFHRYRLDEPARIKKPQTIFVCSMADLFGDWVPDEWIQAVFKACDAAPQHRYLFLTKNPKRYEKVLDRYFPKKMFFGWSQDGPMGNLMNHSTHHSIQSFVSIEPLLRPFEAFYIKGLEWAIVGAETGNRKNRVVPQKKWVDDIANECRKNNVPIFMKESLRSLMGADFVQEFPWEVAT